MAAALAAHAIWIVTFVDSTFSVATYFLLCISTILIVFARPLANGLPEWVSGSSKPIEATLFGWLVLLSTCGFVNWAALGYPYASIVR